MTTPFVVGRHYPISGGATEKRTVGRRHCLLSYLRRAGWGSQGRREGRKGSAAGDKVQASVATPSSRGLARWAEPPSATPVADATGAAPPCGEDEAAPVARGGLARLPSPPRCCGAGIPGDVPPVLDVGRIRVAVEVGDEFRARVRVREPARHLRELRPPVGLVGEV